MIRTVLDLTREEKKLSFDSIMECLAPLVEAGHRNGADVWLTPRQYTEICCDEAAIRRNVGNLTALTLSNKIVFEAGIGRVRILRVPLATVAVVESLLS